MFQVRFHGRGGQGVVTAAELLSVAAFVDGKHAQAFPSFGSERMGAPVMAYCRISDAPIRLREPIFHPDALIVQDASLVRNPDLLAGLDRTRIAVINTRKSLAELSAEQLKHRMGKEKIIVLPATEIAMEMIGRNVPNVIMLAAFCAASGLLGFDTLREAVVWKFKGSTGKANIAAAERAWKLITDAGRRASEVAHA
jgi:pyruvate ferredoxin oxidoreductase gamma subunit